MLTLPSSARTVSAGSSPDGDALSASMSRAMFLLVVICNRSSLGPQCLHDSHRLVSRRVRIAYRFGRPGPITYTGVLTPRKLNGVQACPLRLESWNQVCPGSKVAPDFHMPSMITAILRATATRAFDKPTLRESSRPQVCKALCCLDLHSKTVAAVTR